MPEATKRTPKPAPDRRDPRGLPLSPTDGFVLSRVDGVLTDRELTAITGLPEDLVLTSLAKLEELGLIVFDGARPAPAPRAATPAPAPSSPDPPLTAQEEAALAEDVDVDADLRMAVIAKHRELDASDHYALLDVPRTADRKAIKRAYFDMAAKFHPDRYFRKRLGSFKPWMEAIFSRATLAHDTLGNRQRRAEYDAYLEERTRSRSLEDQLEAAAVEARRAEESVEREIRGVEREARGEPRIPSAPAPAVFTPPPAAPAPVPAVSTPPPATEAEVAARRDLLARRLLGGRARTMPPPVSPSAPPTPGEAVNALRRRYEERIAAAKDAKARAYAAKGDAALASGDLATAATSFRIAANLLPGDAEIERKARETRARADVILSQTYTRQARYEEENGRWAEAALSWGRVCRTTASDAEAHQRGAAALLKAGGDLHEAARLAKRACELAPREARGHVLLAKVYLAAGLEHSARRELETATQITPQDDTIKEMIRRLGTPS